MRVNVSSVQDFYQCRFRWWCKWVMNRVPVATSPALDAGRLLHRIFEDHFLGISMALAAKAHVAEFRRLIPEAHPSAQPSAEQAAQTIEDLIEAFPLWKDSYGGTAFTLEVEQPFEWEDTELDGVTWIGRPDRVIRQNRFVWHMQNRGLAASQNFATYIRLQKRSYHEHLYAEALGAKYGRYGGTIFNLVRKLKYRTNVGKKNEATKTAAEMFYQQPLPINLSSGLHASVMRSLRQHAVDMMQVADMWKSKKFIPAPNEKMNGGYGGSSEDPYFKVLIGEIKLDDDEFFKDREDTYAQAQE